MIFLLDPNNESISVKKTVAGVMSHEIAHMWCVTLTSLCLTFKSLTQRRFGNITTMKWWDNLYLNEGAHVTAHFQKLQLLTPRLASGFASLVSDNTQAAGVIWASCLIANAKCCGRLDG